MWFGNHIFFLIFEKMKLSQTIHLEHTHKKNLSTTIKMIYLRDI